MKCFAGAVVATAYLLTAHQPALADGEAWKFLDQRGRVKEEFRAYVAGICNGIEWMAAGNAVRGETKEYCQPANMARTAGQCITDFEMYIASAGKRDLSSPIGFAVLRSMKHTFPCPGK